METFSQIGKRCRRIDALGKVTGETRFLTDIVIDGMIHAAPVYSSVPHARIDSIDISPIENASGFIHFISAEHIPGQNQVGVIVPDQPLMADTRVRFIGDSIGLVLADDSRTARELASRIELKYSELPPIFSISESRDATGDFLHKTNIACNHQVDRGDIEQGFSAADFIVEESFRTPVQEHYYLEPQGCIAIPNPDGRIRIIGSLQCPFYIQKAVAAVLGTPFNAVIVEQSPTGGAFGGKEDIPSELCARAAVAAVVTGRPVKLVYSRHDDIQLTSKRHPFEMHYRVGVTADGKLTAADIDLAENSGAYATLSSVVSYRATVQAMGPYVVPNVRVRSTSYYTNLPPNGAFRGFGSPQVAFGHERIMDIIAARLEMDPGQFRLLNILEHGAETITGHKLAVSVGARETIDRVLDHSGWPGQKTVDDQGRFRTGMGIAVTHYGNCLGAAGWHLDGSGVTLSLHRDGSVTAAFGLVEMGQGALTAVAQMTAEALGTNPEQVIVAPTCTELVPDSGPSVASRNIVMTGQAIRDAAAKLNPLLRQTAIQLLGCEAQNVLIKSGTARDSLTGSEVSFAQLTEYMFMHNVALEATGWWHVPALDYDPESGTGEAYFTYSYATHLARVKVDTLTGEVNVDKIWAAHDVGCAVNPAGIEGQIEGGTAQGIGWALTEDFKFDQGRALTSNLTTYLLPTARDAAEVIVAIVEEPEPAGPWGAKGIGEPAIIPTAAAVANAVSAALGIQIREIPITPERILDLLACNNH